MKPLMVVLVIFELAMAAVCVALLFVLLGGMSVFAQATAPGAPPIDSGTASAIQIGLGILIAVVVHFSKSIRWINDNPKLVAAILSILSTIAAHYLGLTHLSGIGPYVVEFLTQLAAAIGTHELAMRHLPGPSPSVD